MPVTLGIVEQAPLADLRVTTAGLVGKATARLVPPGREGGADPKRGDSSGVGELLDGWPEGRLFGLDFADLVVQFGERRVQVDPRVVQQTQPDPLALDQWSALERITMAHHDTLQVLTLRTEARAARTSDEPAGQVRLIGVDQGGATALCIRGGIGTRVRIPFRRAIATVDEAIAELGELL
jgi:hypothetical protein